MPSAARPYACWKRITAAIGSPAPKAPSMAMVAVVAGVAGDADLQLADVLAGHALGQGAAPGVAAVGVCGGRADGDGGH